MTTSRRKLTFPSTQVCSLCKRQTSLLSCPNQWTNTRAIEVSGSLGVSTDGPVCSLCRRDIGKVCRGEAIVPCWMKEKVTTKQQCCILNCQNDSQHMSSIENIDSHVSTAQLVCKFDTIPNPTPLCYDHYKMVYTIHNPIQKKCVTCGMSLKNRNPRTCPDAQKIEILLREKTEYNCTISSEDKVCQTCYKLHLRLLNDDKATTNADTLQRTVDTFSQQLPTSIIEGNDIKVEKKVIDLSILKTTIDIGNKLLEGEALLLSTAYDIFQKHASDIIMVNKLPISNENLITVRWLLAKVANKLAHHMKFTCKIRKYGTLIYGSNTDLTAVAAQALWKVRHLESKACDSRTIESTGDSDSMSIVLDDLNDRIHNTARKFIDHDPYDYSTINIKDVIDNVDAKLWNAINQLTKSISECRGTSTVSDSSSDSYHMKQIRCLFILSTLLFCADNRCSMPIHTLLTDIVQSQGGSILLIKILNHLGICSSLDVLQRYMHYTVSHPITQSNHSENTVEIISVDNIDFLHSYARVFNGNRQSSWHGTTIQSVKPLPSLTFFPENITAIEMTTDYRVTTEVLRKRSDRPSPMTSPEKDVRSPMTKKQRRKRTGVDRQVVPINFDIREIVAKYPHTNSNMGNKSQRTLQDFVTNNDEQQALANFQNDVNSFMIYRCAVQNNNTDENFIDLKIFFTLIRPTHMQKSDVKYLEVLDAVADKKDTISIILDDLYEKHIATQKTKYVIVEGDAKIYEILQRLKYEYGTEYSWLIPYPGDWHLLKNYQIPLMKIYFDAGLKALAASCGYPLASIQVCGQFKRTHFFILEVWESIYRAMLIAFLSSNDTLMSADFLSLVYDSLATDTNPNLSCHEILQSALIETNEKVSEFFEEFKKFLQGKARENQNWKFWIQFVFTDALAYVGLYSAIRSGDWSLRMASIKEMAAIFTAFDHQTYQKVITQHLCDVASMPLSLLTFFEQGAFVVNIKGRPWHSIAIDEAHEMLINKSCKTSIVKPNPDFISRIARYLPHRTQILENLLSQIMPNTKEKKDEVKLLLTSNPVDKKMQKNIEQQIKILTEHSLFDTDHEKGLINPFNKSTITQEQVHDLMNFRAIGHKQFLLRISSTVLKDPSVKAPNRKNNLKTFTDKKKKTRHISQLEKDRQLVLSAMRRKMSFSRRTGQPINNLEEQIIELPLAICDNDGFPIKGQKSFTTKHYEARYQSSDPPVFGHELNWVPSVVLIEGMFLINVTPLNLHKTISDYCKFLLNRFVISEFKKGSQEIHVIFDNPGEIGHSPKFFEQNRRDKQQTTSTTHYCDEISGEKKINHAKWREDFLNCRQCKRNLVLFLGDFLIKNAAQYLVGEQILYIAGCFRGDISQTAWYTQTNGMPQPDPAFISNAEETDTRLWLHATKTQHRNILIMSPDTDIYHIGLPLSCTINKEIVIQISPINSRDKKLLNATNFVKALKNDPDLADINEHILGHIVQTIYITTGCDYISFFSHIGKSTFLKYFFQYSSFITSGKNSNKPGTLADTDLSNEDLGYLSFLRLVGTIYFKKHATGFSTPSPEIHFHSIISASLDPKTNHLEWLKAIRTNIWERIKFENEMIPSNEALLFHWKRSCWIARMWRQADCNNIILDNMVGNGWIDDGNTIGIQWDSNANREAVKNRVATLLRGCSCKKGCNTARCGCRKRNEECREGCKCIECENYIANPSLQSGDIIDVLECEELYGTDEMDEEMINFNEYSSESESELI